MNGYAKHHDKTELNVLEYLMYQTGNIIRLLITLKQAEPAPDIWVGINYTPRSGQGNDP